MGTTHRREVAESYAHWQQILTALAGDPPDDSYSDVLHRVAVAVCGVFDCRHAVISILDEGGALEYLVAHDAAQDGSRPAEAVPGSLLGVPISYDGRTFGGLYLSDPAEREQFTDPEAEAAGLIAAGIAATIRRNRALAANDLRQRWLIESAELSRDLLVTEPANPLRLVVDRVQAMAGADLVAVAVERPGGETFEVLEAAGPYADRARGRILDAAATFAHELIARGEPTVLDGLSRKPQRGLVAVVGAEAGVLVPLLGPGSRNGMLVVLRRPERAPFTPIELELTVVFATQMGLALELMESRAHRERVALLDERDRIARDLHDHVIQRLFAVGLTVQDVANHLGGEQARRLLAGVDDIDGTIAQIRSTIYRLSGPMLAAESSLRVRVARLLEELEPVLGFRVELTIRGPVDFGMDDDLAQDCLAVLREALTNVARHAGATRAAVAIAIGTGRLEIEVCDDGRGMGRPARRSGLANLRVRAEQRGGSLLVASGARGSRLTWTIPWAPAAVSA